MQPSVSVIVPVYNIEQYIGKCLESIVGQTLKEIEIIVVDDGSTDDSSRIIDRYARTDSRIVAIHKTNGGVVSARNCGIARATGSYILFVDGDDHLESDTCERLLKKAQATRADMVIMRFDIEYPQHKEEPRFWSQDEYDPVTAIHTMAHEEFRWSLWSRLMRKELFDRPVDCPPQLIFGEDAYQITQLTYRAQKIVTLRDKTLYHYTVRDSSVSQHAMTRQKAESIKSYPQFIERFLQQTPDSEMFREDIVYIKFQAYLILLLKNWETGMKARCRFMSRSLKKYPRLKEISEVKRFTKLIHLYSFSSFLGKLYMKYYIRKGKIRI